MFGFIRLKYAERKNIRNRSTIFFGDQEIIIIIIIIIINNNLYIYICVVSVVLVSRRLNIMNKNCICLLLFLHHYTDSPIVQSVDVRSLLTFSYKCRICWLSLTTLRTKHIISYTAYRCTTCIA